MRVIVRTPYGRTRRITHRFRTANPRQFQGPVSRKARRRGWRRMFRQVGLNTWRISAKTPRGNSVIFRVIRRNGQQFNKRSLPISYSDDHGDAGDAGGDITTTRDATKSTDRQRRTLTENAATHLWTGSFEARGHFPKLSLFRVASLARRNWLFFSKRPLPTAQTTFGQPNSPLEHLTEIQCACEYCTFF